MIFESKGHSVPLDHFLGATLGAGARVAFRDSSIRAAARATGTSSSSTSGVSGSGSGTGSGSGATGSGSGTATGAGSGGGAPCGEPIYTSWRQIKLNLPPQADNQRRSASLLGLNCGKTHCLECIKDVALDVEEHSREYEPWD